MTDPIPVDDLAEVVPGSGDYIAGSQLGSTRKFRLSNLPASTAAQAQLDAIATEAEAAQAAAEAAQAAAEAARDAAQLSAGIYADTAAGIAATVDGEYFSVPSAESDEYLILYKNVAEVATEIQTYPSAAAVQALEAIESVTTPKVDHLFGQSRYRDAVGEFAYSFSDLAGRVALGIRRNGDTYMAGAEMAVPRDSSRVLWGVQDANGNVAFGVQRDGSTRVSLLRVVVDVPDRDYAPYQAAIADAAGKALLSWDTDGKVDFLPSTALLNRMAVGGTVSPDAGGYYTYNTRGDGTHTFQTVQAPDQSVYETVSLDASATGTQIVAGPAVIEGLFFYGQSNAGRDGASGVVITDAKYPSHAFGFSASDPNTSVSLQYGATPVDPLTLTDLLPIQDYTSATTTNLPATLSSFAIEWNRRRDGGFSPGLFMRTDWYGGQPLTSFIRGTTTWDNLMVSANKMQTVCATYGRTAEVKALVFIQGESGPTDGTYSATLNAFLDDVLPELALQSGQDETPYAILVQTNMSDTAAFGLSEPNIAQLATAQSRDDTVLAGPMYQCPIVDDNHSTPEGEMVMSEMIAQAYLAGPTFKPLWPTSAVLAGSVITVSFNIPGDGLAFDVDWITAAVNDQGFDYTDDTTSAAISSVAIVGDTVEITLSAAPTGANPTLTYASEAADSLDDGWASGRGLLYSPTAIPSYYASLGYAVPETIRHYCCKFSMGVT